MDRPLVVYDGECPFCQRQVELLRRWDRDGRFVPTPKQTPGLIERFPRLAESDFNTGMRLIETDGTIWVGADAVYHIARRLPGWRRVAWLYRAPGIHRLARVLYAWIAANRYRLVRRRCSKDCSLDPSPSAADGRSFPGKPESRRHATR